MQLQIIEINSNQYQQACQLRYQLFFQEHDLPYEVVLDEDNPKDKHMAIIDRGLVIAYARLTLKPDHNFQIYQMVVHPDYQRQGYGQKLLAKSITIAQQNQADKIILDARVSAIGFYQKLGFQTFGSQHPSSTTGVPHIYMSKSLRN